MNWRNVIIVVVLVLPFFILLALGFGLNPREVPSVLIGKSAPRCELKDFNNQAVDFSKYSNLPMVINFWATWCVPCKTEHPILQQASKYFADRIQFIGIVYQDQLEPVQKYLRAKGNNYPQFIDPQSTCSINYGVAGVPETFFINKAGVVIHKESGPVSYQLLQRIFPKLINE